MNTTEIEILKPRSLTKDVERVKQPLRKYLDKNFINSTIASMPMGQDRMLLTFLWMSGVRITEAISLIKKNIDFQNRMMTVQWLKSRKYQQRIVPIHSRLSPMLQIYVSQLRADDKVFSITRQRAYQITKKHLNCSPHQLRHSFAVNWLRSKGDLVTLHRILGHSKIQTTMEYLKIVPIDQSEELEKVNFW